MEGMDIAVRSMHPGEKSVFVLGPQYAFGSEGVPKHVPPNSVLILDIELVAVANRMYKLTPVQDVVNDILAIMNIPGTDPSVRGNQILEEINKRYKEARDSFEGRAPHDPNVITDLGDISQYNFLADRYVGTYDYITNAQNRYEVARDFKNSLNSARDRNAVRTAQVRNEELEEQLKRVQATERQVAEFDRKYLRR